MSLQPWVTDAVTIVAFVYLIIAPAFALIGYLCYYLIKWWFQPITPRRPVRATFDPEAPVDLSAYLRPFR